MVHIWTMNFGYTKSYQKLEKKNLIIDSKYLKNFLYKDKKKITKKKNLT